MNHFREIRAWITVHRFLLGGRATHLGGTNPRCQARRSPVFPPKHPTPNLSRTCLPRRRIGCNGETLFECSNSVSPPKNIRS
jgi:hypothetical protein